MIVCFCLILTIVFINIIKKNYNSETTTNSNAQLETTNTKYAAKITTHSNAQQETTDTKYAAKITTGKYYNTFVLVTIRSLTFQ